jgi:hypothetical protein
MKPKFILCLALVLSGGLLNFVNIVHGAGEPSALKVMIDIPEICQNGKFAPPQLENRYPNYDHFFVVVENISSNSICIPNEDDVKRVLHFEITSGDGKMTTLYRLPLAHAKYVSYDLRLAPGEATVREIYYGRDWDKFPFPHDPHLTEQTNKVTIRAVFEQKPLKDAMPPATWVGRIVSEPYEVILEDDAL